jgi:hypothetical protein
VHLGALSAPAQTRFNLWYEDKRVIKDSEKGGAKKIIMGRSKRHFIPGGEEHLFVRRFPGFA